jgi:hypothetical protein
MSKIETMKHSSKSAAQERGIETMTELHKTIKAMSLGDLEQMAEILKKTPLAFTEEMARELTPLLTALANMIQQARDVAQNLEQTMVQSKSTLLKADEVITESTKSLEAAEIALKLIQAPSKTLLEQILPWLVLGGLAANLLTLLVVVFRVVRI